MLIRKYMMGSSVPTGSGFQAFVAPAAWTDASQFATYGETINIVDAYNAYSDTNKKYVFSVGTTATTVLPAVSGRSYAYAENGGSYTVITSGTVSWAGGSTQRHVIVIDTNATLSITFDDRATWAYLGNATFTSMSVAYAQLKYIHCLDISSIKSYGNLSYNQLTGVLNITSAISSIGDFTGNLITHINISSGITSLPSWSFYSNGFLLGVNSLDDLILPDSITSIGGNSFTRSGILGVLYISKYIDSIGGGALAGSFTSIQIDSLNPYYFADGCAIYDKNKTTLLTAIGKYSGTWVIPNTVTSMRDWECHAGPGITSITIPASITYFGNYFAYDCTGLTSINVLNTTPPAIQDSLPHSLYPTCTIHVPTGTLAAYRAATIWGSFTNIIADL